MLTSNSVCSKPGAMRAISRWSAREAFGPLALSTLLGCGGSSASTAVEAPVSITNSPEVNSYLDSICTFMVRAGAYPKKLTCAQGLMEAMGRTLVDLASALKAGTVNYHSDRAATCAAEALSLPCTQDASDTLLADCALPFEGTTANGGICHTGYECLAGSGCTSGCSPWDLVTCCTGTCAPTTTSSSVPTRTGVGDGASCTAANTICENLTSYCDLTSGTCQPSLAVGAKCSSDGSCIGFAMCNGGTCQIRPGIGENCKLSGGGTARCLVGGCDQSNVCAMTNTVVVCF
jgi:hypothetical protein